MRKLHAFKCGSLYGYNVLFVSFFVQGFKNWRRRETLRSVVNETHNWTAIRDVEIDKATTSMTWLKLKATMRMMATKGN